MQTRRIVRLALVTLMVGALPQACSSATILPLPDSGADSDVHDADGGDPIDSTADTSSPLDAALPDTAVVDGTSDAAVEVGPGSISVVSDATWRASTTAPTGWSSVGFDDSSWAHALSPAKDACGWTYTPATLMRPHESFEHAGTATLGPPVSGLPRTYFRKTVFIPPGASVVEAMVTTVSDDDHKLYVNGVEVASDTSGASGPPISTDIRSQLVPGANVIAVELIDTGLCTWLVVDGTVRW